MLIVESSCLEKCQCYSESNKRFLCIFKIIMKQISVQSPLIGVEDGYSLRSSQSQRPLLGRDSGKRTQLVNPVAQWMREDVCDVPVTSTRIQNVMCAAVHTWATPQVFGLKHCFTLFHLLKSYPSVGDRKITQRQKKEPDVSPHLYLESEALKAVRQAMGEGTSERMRGRHRCPPPPKVLAVSTSFKVGKTQKQRLTPPSQPFPQIWRFAMAAHTVSQQRQT